MNSDRIKEIQKGTAYPDSISVMQALTQVWNEVEQEKAAAPVDDRPMTEDGRPIHVRTPVTDVTWKGLHEK
jgi:hypothetical protein